MNPPNKLSPNITKAKANFHNNLVLPELSKIPKHRLRELREFIEVALIREIDIYKSGNNNITETIAYLMVIKNDIPEEIQIELFKEKIPSCLHKLFWQLPKIITINPNKRFFLVKKYGISNRIYTVYEIHYIMNKWMNICLDSAMKKLKYYTLHPKFKNESFNIKREDF